MCEITETTATEEVNMGDIESPLTMQEEETMYDVIEELRHTARNDPAAPPLNELYVLVEIDNEEQVKVKGSLLALKDIDKHLIPEALDMVHALPEAKGTFLVVIDHYAGLGVHQLSYKSIKSTPPTIDVVRVVVESKEDKEGSFKKLVSLNLKDIVHTVDELCKRRLAAGDSWPTCDHIAATCVDNQGTLHGIIMTKEELFRVGSADVQEVVTRCLKDIQVADGHILTLFASKEGLAALDVKPSKEPNATTAHAVRSLN